ncbi:MAG: STAS domain-containing protein [Pseudomonadota bacterium]
MEITYEKQGLVTVAKLTERRLDAAMAVRFKDAMRPIADQVDGRMVLNLGNVEFMDSSGLGALVALMKYLGPERPLDLASLQPMVDKVFRLTRMDGVFSIYKTVDQALSVEAKTA